MKHFWFNFIFTLFSLPALGQDEIPVLNPHEVIGQTSLTSENCDSAIPLTRPKYCDLPVYYSESIPKENQKETMQFFADLEKKGVFRDLKDIHCPGKSGPNLKDILDGGDNEKVEESTLVVGGGPGGLVAVLEALCAGVWPVTLVNNREDYVRGQTTFFDLENWKAIGRYLNLDNLEAQTEMVSTLQKRKLFLFFSLDEKKAIRIDNMEKMLAFLVEKIARQYPDKLSVHYNTAFESFNLKSKSVTLKNKGQNCQFSLSPASIIGADGSKSAVREAANFSFIPQTEDGYSAIGIMDFKRFSLKNKIKEKNRKKIFFRGPDNGNVNLSVGKMLAGGDYLAEGGILKTGDLPNFSSKKIWFTSKNSQFIPRARAFIEQDQMYLAVELTKDQKEFFERPENAGELKKYLQMVALAYYPFKAPAKEKLSPEKLQKLAGEIDLIDEDVLGRSGVVTRTVKQATGFNKMILYRGLDLRLKELNFYLIGDAESTVDYFWGLGANKAVENALDLGTYLRSDRRNTDFLILQQSISSLNDSNFKLETEGIHQFGQGLFESPLLKKKD